VTPSGSANVADFRTETRWPQYSPAVLDVGVLSGLSFKLYTADRSAGALDLFGFAAITRDAEAESVDSVLAAQAGEAIIATCKKQLHAALADPRPHRQQRGSS